MKKIEAYVTRDKKIHTSHTDPVNWCLEKYNTAISRLAHAIVACDFKYLATLELIRTEDFEKAFKEAIAWKEDLEPEDE